MSYSEELDSFTELYPYKKITVESAMFRYILAGSQTAPALVFLNGGMNVSEMWMRYVSGLFPDLPESVHAIYRQVRPVELQI